MKNKFSGFTLIELLVVISIIALLSSVIFTSITITRKKARDSQRIQNARQIAIALEQYEQANQTYKVVGAGISGGGTGYVAKVGGSYTGSSILSTLKTLGYMKSINLKDPIYDLDNYYIGLCTSTNAFNVFVKLEQPEYNQATSSIINTCGGVEAANAGFSYIGATTGGTAGGGSAGIAGSYEAGMGPGGGGGFVCGVSTIQGKSPDNTTYQTVMAEDGICWLASNLGTPNIATSYNDYLAYGSLYQWGRASDGHQLRTCTDSATCSSVNGSTAVLSTSTTPGHSNFITNSITSPYDWINPQTPSLWQGLAGTNNPCPEGFRIPTRSEWTNVLTKASITNYTTAFNSSLKLTAAGDRSRMGAALFSLGTDGYYWSSTVTGSDTFKLYLNSGNAHADSAHNRAFGDSVRCLKD